MRRFVALLLLTCPDLAFASPVELDVALAKEAAAIDKSCGEETFSGAALVAVKGAQAWTHACGLADRERAATMTKW
ncbi:MAG: hypothetical protein U1E87_03880 [Alphaproteobacteria bacterium]